jgi:hypothetical protein
LTNLKSQNSGNINSIKKVKILIVALLLLISGLSFFGFLPNLLGAEPGSDMPDQDLPEAGASGDSRSSRSIDYDMNLTRPGKHQDMTIYGRRAKFTDEQISSITSMAVGDVTGDGIDDLVIGAAGDNISINKDCGMVYVIFGMSSLPSYYNMSNHIGLTIQGLDTDDFEGSAVAVGDINGDGVGDIITGVPTADGLSNNNQDIGEVHIFHGGSDLTSIGIWNLSETSPDLTIIGNETGDRLGSSLAIGNLNQDIYDDLIMGAPGGDGISGGITNSGEVVVLYGGGNIGAAGGELELSAPVNAVIKTFYGKDVGDWLGSAVVSGGDFNGDGREDVGMVARFGEGVANDPGTEKGEVYIIQWQNSMPNATDLTAMPANLTIYGKLTNDHIGYHSISFGDVNADNYADLLVGAPGVDGSSGSVTDSGAVFIFYGTRALPGQTWDLTTIPANVSIYSNTNDDEVGIWTDCFDWDDDGIDDIVFGVPNASGPGDSYTFAGEVIIINGSSNLPMSTNIQGNRRGFYFFGADFSDHLGRVVTHGDFNGDGVLDLFAFASNADGYINNYSEAGEVYVTFGETSKIPQVNSLKILNADLEQGATLYTKLRSYDFEVKITAPRGILDLKDVTLTLDPQGLNLSIFWDRVSDAFSVLNGPETLVDLVGNASAIDANNWTITFSLDFDWQTPRTVDFREAWVNVYNILGFNLSRRFGNMYRIENKLNFTGLLDIKGGDDRALPDNAWVKGNEPVSWKGLTVVYDGTTDVFPNASEYDVTLWNTTDSWVDAGSPGEEINITTITGTKSLAYDNYTINITGVPSANDVSNLSHHLRLDADNINFSNPTPVPDIWLTESLVTCGVTVKDIGGTQVDGSTIEYQTTDNNGLIWSNWTSAGDTSVGTLIMVSKEIQFADGTEHMIHWRGNDTMGNGYGYSSDYPLKVDTEDIIFSNPSPGPAEMLSTINVEFGIEIADNLSGVNESSIEYTYSLDDGVTWSDWINLNLSGINTTTQVVANQTFNTGNKNLVKWRASDVAGNGPVESPIQRFDISIPTADLKTYLLVPENDIEVSAGSKTLAWWSNDNSSYIKFYVYFSKDRDSVVDFSPAAQMNEIGISDRFYKTDDLENFTTYYWTIVPYNTTGKVGICADGIWSFRVNPAVVDIDVPIFTVISPGNGSTIQILRPTFMWKMEYKITVGVRYDLYFGTIEDVLTLYKAGLSKALYSAPDDLENHMTYYWRVKAHSGELDGEHWSPTWNFNINMSSVIREKFDFSLDTTDSKSIEIKPGESIEISFNVINLKDPSSVELSIQSGMLALTEDTIFTFSRSSISLEENDIQPVTLTVKIPKDFKGDDYQFIIVGKMTESGEVITKTLDFDLTVKAKDSDGGGEEDDMTFVIGIAAVIIIVVILLIVFLIIIPKKKAKAAEGEPEPRVELEAAEPAEAIPGPALEGELPMAEPTGMEEAIPPGEPVPEPAPEPGMPVEEVPGAPVEPEGAPPEAPAPVEGEAPPAPGEAPPPVPEGAPEGAEAAIEPELPSDLPSDAFEGEGAPPPVEPGVVAPEPAEGGAPPEPTEPVEPAAPEPMAGEEAAETKPTEGAEPEEPKPEGKKPEDTEDS